jgi:ABC-type polysaccharide/polyol phosphate transport system ATPase subunit
MERESRHYCVCSPGSIRRSLGFQLPTIFPMIAPSSNEVAAFTELGEYLDLHVGAYSSGMRERLAFAISTTLEPDILIIDEIFGAGGAFFYQES